MNDAEPPPGEPAPRPDSAPAEPTHLHLTAEAVKVLAHPLRSRLLSALRRGGPATATDLAVLLRSNTGATSYHLRRLESVGLVEDTGEGAGKRRLWRASTRSHGWTRSELADDEDAATAIGWLVRDYHRQFDAEYGHWLDVSDAWPREWQDAAEMSDAPVQVTPERLVRMNEEFKELLQRYRDIDAGDPRARRVHLWNFAYPMEVDDVPGLNDADDADAADDAHDDGPGGGEDAPGRGAGTGADDGSDDGSAGPRGDRGSRS